MNARELDRSLARLQWALWFVAALKIAVLVIALAACGAGDELPPPDAGPDAADPLACFRDGCCEQCCNPATLDAGVNCCIGPMEWLDYGIGPGPTGFPGDVGKCQP